MWSWITPREAFQVYKIQAAKTHDTSAEAHIHLETFEIIIIPRLLRNRREGGVHGQTASRASPLLLPQHILTPCTPVVAPRLTHL